MAKVTNSVKFAALFDVMGGVPEHTIRDKYERKFVWNTVATLVDGEFDNCAFQAELFARLAAAGIRGVDRVYVYNWEPTANVIVTITVMVDDYKVVKPNKQK